MDWACNRLGALGFLVAITFWPGLLSASSTPRWWVLALGLPFVCSLDPRKLPPVAMWLIWATLAWVLLLMMLNPEIFGAPLHLIQLLILCAAGIAGAEQEDLTGFMAPFGWGVAVSVPFCLSQYFGGYIGSLVVANGPAGLFLNTEVMALTAAPVLVWSLFSRRVVLSLLLLIPLILCGSRVSLIAAGIGVLYGVWPLMSRWIKGILAVAAIGAVAYLGIFWGVGRIISAEARVTLWGGALLSITPLGMGLGGWAEAHPFAYEEMAHSDILQAMAELGLGSIFLLALPVIILWRRVSLAEGAAFAAICAECVVSFPLHLPATGFLAAVLAGYLVRLRLGSGVAAHQGRATGGSGVSGEITDGPAMARSGAGCSGSLPHRSAYPDHPGRGAQPGAAAAGGD